MASLFDEFPHTGYAEWLTQLKSDLKSENVDYLLKSAIEDLQIPLYLDETSVKQKGNPI